MHTHLLQHAMRCVRLVDRRSIAFAAKSQCTRTSVDLTVHVRDSVGNESWKCQRIHPNLCVRCNRTIYGHTDADWEESKNWTANVSNWTVWEGTLTKLINNKLLHFGCALFVSNASGRRQSERQQFDPLVKIYFLICFGFEFLLFCFCFLVDFQTMNSFTFLFCDVSNFQPFVRTLMHDASGNHTLTHAHKLNLTKRKLKMKLKYGKSDAKIILRSVWLHNRRTTEKEEQHLLLSGVDGVLVLLLLLLRRLLSLLFPPSMTQCVGAVERRAWTICTLPRCARCCAARQNNVPCVLFALNAARANDDIFVQSQHHLQQACATHSLDVVTFIHIEKENHFTVQNRFDGCRERGPQRSQ